MQRLNLGALIDLEADGERVLLVDCRDWASPRHWTGAELERETNALARGLRGRGLGATDRVAILSANRGEYLTAYNAALRAGLIAVPVNTRLPPDTVRYVLEDCGAKLAFVDAAHREAACGLPTVCFDDDGYADLRDPGQFEAIVPEPDAVAMFLYTSGSTGRPKGVPLTHRGHLWVVARRLQPGVDYRRQRMLVAAPLYHMNALAICQLAAAAGATVVLLPRFDPGRYLAAVERFACTSLTSVPTMIALVTRRTEALHTTDLSSVESVRMGSAPVTAELLDRVEVAFPRARVQIGYGTTEAGPVVFGPHPDGLATPRLSLGYPHPEVRLRLVRDGREADEGVLEMSCPAVMPGYHNLAERTAAVMSADGYYRTGDVMRRDRQGFYFFVGRDDDMFVCNGENVYPEAVERLLESHPDVVQACVVPVPDPVRGQMPVAFVVGKDGRIPDEEALKGYAIAHGPAYQHPRYVFALDELPLGGTGKLDRRALAVQAERGVRERPGGERT